MTDEDIAKTCARYRKRWLEYGYDPRTLGWNKDCQWVRYAAVFEGLRPEDFGSIFDVGCGFGDLLVFLRCQGWEGQYLGIDLVPELIDQARLLHAQDTASQFVCGDAAGFSPQHGFDLAVALGAFNHRIAQGNLEFIRESIDKMWAISSQVVVCDFLSTCSDPQKREPHLYYSEPAEMLALATRYTRRVMVHHGYMPFEFQIKMWHANQFEVSAPVFSPYLMFARKQSEWRDNLMSKKEQ